MPTCSIRHFGVCHMAMRSPRHILQPSSQLWKILKLSENFRNSAAKWHVLQALASATSAFIALFIQPVIYFFSWSLLLLPPSHSLVWHRFHRFAHHLFAHNIAAKMVGTCSFWGFLQWDLSAKRQTWFICCRLYTFNSVLACPSYIQYSFPSLLALQLLSL